MKHSPLLALALVIALQLLSLSPSNAAGQLSVTVSTDKQSYGPGELITIDGMVRDETSQAVAFVTVSIQVNDPSGNPIHITSVLSGVDGSFSDQFTVPAGSVDGGYTVFTTATKPGYTEASNQTAYTVIPEFPVSNMLGLILPALFATMIVVKRKPVNMSR